MIRFSIRWRLPLSYAAIALLTALALGAVLLLALRSYYLRVERDYIQSHAQAIAFNLSQVLADEPPAEAIQSLLGTYSLLSATTVRLKDTQGELVADASRSGRSVVRLPASPGLLPPLLRPDPSQPGGRSSSWPGSSTPIVITRTQSLTSPLAWDQRERLTLAERLLQTGAITWTLSPTQPLVLDQGQRLALAEYVLRTMDSSGRPNPQAGNATSSQVVQLPILSTENQLLGYVELAEGPAYAREIVADVALGWGIGSAVAVVLAAIVGWLISRRISSPLIGLTKVTASMANGDLTARADLNRRDELGTLARSFNLMAGQIEEIVATLQRFVSDAAHEIHTPLTALRTNLELAHQDAQEGTEEHIALAQREVDRLEAMTSALLDLSRLESGSRTPRFEPVDLHSLAHQVGERYASRAEQAGLAFELRLGEEPLAIQGDREQLERALANVLENAVKFTPEGGTIRLSLAQKEGLACLWVEDTGIGIPEADLPHLFQRFHRGRNASAYAGSGLGLAIVKAIVEQHDGSVHAERRHNGTRFAICIPTDSGS